MSNEELYTIIKNANSLKSQGYYNKALENYKNALNVCLESVGEIHKDTATVYSYMGIIHKSLGQYDQALDYYLKALDIYLQTLEENSPVIAKLYNNIGLSFNAQEKFEEALLHFEKALQTYVSFLGKQKTIVTATYNNMGFVFDLNLEYNEALENFDRTLHSKLSSLHNSHPECRNSYRANDSIYKSKLNFYNSYKIIQKDIDKELEKRNTQIILSDELPQININKVFKNIKKVSIKKEQKGF